MAEKVLSNLNTLKDIELGIDTQAEVAQKQRKINGNELKAIEQTFTNLVGSIPLSKRDKFSKEITELEKAKDSLVKGEISSEEFYRAASEFRKKVLESSELTEKEKEAFKEAFNNFMRAVVPLLMNDVKNMPGLQNTYIAEEAINRWFEQYLKTASESQEMWNKDFLLRLSYVSEIVRQSAMNMMEGKPLDDTAKETLNKENAWGLVYGTTVGDATFAQSVPVLTEKAKA